MKFRKKPVVIEAKQFDGSVDSYLSILDWMKASGDTAALADEVRYSTPEMTIQTLEGTHTARPDDWIIKGVKGEFYPCKPDIFVATYEPVESGNVQNLAPSTAALLKYFAYEHLPPHLQTISKPFGDLARLVANGPQNAETTVALRKLLEAKDCAVRAALT